LEGVDVALRKEKVELPIIAFASAHVWEAWLAAHGSESKGIWLKLAKKESGIASLSRQEAIDGALCYGWIDGQTARFDERQWLVRFTPRRQRSIWSEINRSRARVLIDEGKMRCAGLKEIERAKADGRWDAAYPSQSKALVPEDLQRALKKNPAAGSFFLKLNSVNRYAILHRIHNAKQEATRESRIEKFVEMLARGETIHPVKEKEPVKKAKRK
jgi:uncharacterized protein YdeI (YjbR/CyaY-like superfamily)